MLNENRDLKKLFKQFNIPQWRIAKEIGICERTLITWLRDDEVTDEHLELIRQAVKAILERRKKNSEVKHEPFIQRGDSG